MTDKPTQEHIKAAEKIASEVWDEFVVTNTVQFGWWLFPALITIISIIWAHTRCPHYISGARRFSMDGFVYLFFYGIASIISLIAWLIWAVLT